MKTQQVFFMLPQKDVDEIRDTLKDIQGKLSGKNSKENILGDYVSEKEAQELLNRKTTWFWQKRKTGELIGKKAGNQWFYKMADIQGFIENGKS
ncbi:MAG: hypothetical protein AB7S69_06330 [Salinivirgaceae bacterium]